RRVDLRAGTAKVLLIQRLLPSRHADALDLLDPPAKLSEHLLLRTAAAERPHARPKTARDVLVPMTDRRLPALIELAPRLEEARHREVKERPELAQVIFDGRAGEHPPLPRTKRERGFRRQALGVLDVLSLIQDDRAEVP